ncbi:MAG TPA: alpha/beta hydrolase [Candidatus Avibacteroides faecavium]|nr:alpha/beta hydrolase [Candidatus Avibacteroides faecavium]
MKKKTVFWSLAILATLAVTVIVTAHFMLVYSLQPDNRGKDLQGSFDYMYEEYPFLRPWVDSLETAGALRDTFIVNDGARLHAYYVAAPEATRATAVIVHGYTDNAIRMFMLAHLYNHELRYNVLLPDLHYSGLSDGDCFRMGWLDRLDVMRWMDVADSIFGGTQMVVHGISMGAATTMMVSGEEQRPFVRCFVEDCGYTSVWDEFEHELRGRFGLPAFPLLHVADWLCGVEHGWTFREASAVEQVKKCRLPMLFIHGAADDFVPTWMVYELFEAKPQPKEIWVVPGAAHAVSYRDNRDQYVWRVRNFVSRHIKE